MPSVSVGTSAVQLVGGRSLRKGLLIQNNHASQNVFVGTSSSVTASGAAATDGVKIAAGATLTIPVRQTGAIYAIADGAATDVRYFEVF